MPLPLPNLDDRRWADLVEEGRALIPLYAPEWTDHNLHDPGITLLELFAWIAEMDCYQLNRVSDRHKRKFLQLIGVEPKPPRGARVPVSFQLKDHVPYVRLPATLECEGRDPFGRTARFRLLDGITVLPAELQAVQRRDSDRFYDLTRRWRRGEDLLVYGDDPRPGFALYLGFSHPLPPDQVSSLYVTTPNPSAGADGDDDAASTRVARHHSVRTRWEFLNEQGVWRSLPPALGAIVDETQSFTSDGRVLITPPSAMGARVFGTVKTPLYYVRCRFTSGSYDAAPMARAIVMNTVMSEQMVPVGDLALTAPGAPDVETERLGEGTGRPAQQLVTSQAPIQTSSLRLFTVAAGEWREWTRRSDLDSSGRADSHFVVDAMTGVVTFGSGDRGRTVPRGALVVASYRSTRAADGNLPADAIDRVAPSGHNVALVPDLATVVGQLRRVSNPIAASDGAAAETVAEAQGRVLEEMERPRRAVTLADYEQLAKSTPGVRLARVAARALLHPAFPCLKAPGSITVIVLPYLPAGRPVPSRELLQSVTRRLNRLRSIGTRVEVTGPLYKEIAVRATVEIVSRSRRHCADGANRRRVEPVSRSAHRWSGRDRLAVWPRRLPLRDSARHRPHTGSGSRRVARSDCRRRHTSVRKHLHRRDGTRRGRPASDQRGEAS